MSSDHSVALGAFCARRDQVVVLGCRWSLEMLSDVRSIYAVPSFNTSFQRPSALMPHSRVSRRPLYPRYLRCIVLAASPSRRISWPSPLTSEVAFASPSSSPVTIIHCIPFLRTQKHTAYPAGLFAFPHVGSSQRLRAALPAHAIEAHQPHIISFIHFIRPIMDSKNNATLSQSAVNYQLD